MSVAILVQVSIIVLPHLCREFIVVTVATWLVLRIINSCPPSARGRRKTETMATGSLPSSFAAALCVMGYGGCSDLPLSCVLQHPFQFSELAVAVVATHGRLLRCRHWRLLRCRMSRGPSGAWCQDVLGTGAVGSMNVVLLRLAKATTGHGLTTRAGLFRTRSMQRSAIGFTSAMKSSASTH
jgi:hypothetical protein